MFAIDINFYFIADIYSKNFISGTLKTILNLI